MTDRYHNPSNTSQSDDDRRVHQGYHSRQSNQDSDTHTRGREESGYWGDSRGSISGYSRQQAPSQPPSTFAPPDTTIAEAPPRFGPHNSLPYSQRQHPPRQYYQGQPVHLLSSSAGAGSYRQTPNPPFQAAPSTANSGYGGYYGGVSHPSSRPGMTPASYPGYHQYAASQATGGHREDSPPIPFRPSAQPYNDPKAFTPTGISSLSASLAPPRAPSNPRVENETYNDNLTGSHPNGVDNRDIYGICPACDAFTGAWGCRSCGPEQFMSWAPR